MAAGKRVLFVSEKMAALRGVRATQAVRPGRVLPGGAQPQGQQARGARRAGAALSAPPPPADPAFPYAELAATARS